MRSYIYQCPECQDRMPIPEPPDYGNEIMCDCGERYELSQENNIEDQRADHLTRQVTEGVLALQELARAVNAIVELARREQNGN